MERFAGTPDEYAGYEQARIAVVPVPYDATSTWVRGADQGPEALLYASVALEWYDIETRTEVYRQGIYTDTPIAENRTPELLCQAVEQRLNALLRDGKFPVTIGGNHTVSIGAFRAFAKQFNKLTILQLDAHSDLRPIYEGSELNHACVMNQARQLAPITQVGIRSMCVEELGNFDPERIFYAHNASTSLSNRTEPVEARSLSEVEAWQQRAINTLTENVYITIDLDVFDPSILPSTGTPEPGGLGYYQVLNFLRRVIDSRNVVGLDVVELCPNPTDRSSDFLAAKLIYQLLSWKYRQ